MTAGQHAGADRATVAGVHAHGHPAPGGQPEPTTEMPARRPLTPDQLHDSRVAWGQLWGARISAATKQWKGEVG